LFESLRFIFPNATDEQPSAFKAGPAADYPVDMVHYRRTARTRYSGGKTKGKDPSRSAAAHSKTKAWHGQGPAATPEDAHAKEREEDASHEKYHTLIARDQLTERADGEDDRKQRRRHARREDQGRGRELPTSALNGGGNERGQKRDHATGRK